MKKLILLSLTLVLMGLAGPVLAEKKAKSSILHCGCAYDLEADTASMVYEAITISARSRGHDGHVAGTIDSCYTGQELVDDELVDQFADFVRNGDDCQLDGPPLREPIDDCEADDLAPGYVEAGDSCGIEVL
jgi:hypothetical protein